jgi:hypothetical protein
MDLVKNGRLDFARFTYHYMASNKHHENGMSNSLQLFSLQGTINPKQTTHCLSDSIRMA